MQYWLMKSEPDAYSIQQLEKDGTSGWDGVRNYQARNFMRDQMRKGDQVLFYHSNTKEPGVYGIAEVCKESHPDHTQFDKKSKYYDAKADKANPRWFMVAVKHKQTFSSPVTLEQMREQKKLKELLILRKGNRLSITPVSPQEFQVIKKLGSK